MLLSDQGKIDIQGEIPQLMAEYGILTEKMFEILKTNLEIDDKEAMSIISFTQCTAVMDDEELSEKIKTGEMVNIFQEFVKGDDRK